MTGSAVKLEIGLERTGLRQLWQDCLPPCKEAGMGLIGVGLGNALYVGAAQFGTGGAALLGSAVVHAAGTCALAIGGLAALNGGAIAGWRGGQTLMRRLRRLNTLSR